MCEERDRALVRHAVDAGFGGRQEDPYLVQKVLMRADCKPFRHPKWRVGMVVLMGVLLAAAVGIAAGMGLFGQFAQKEQGSQRRVLQQVEERADIYHEETVLPTAEPQPAVTEPETDVERIARETLDRKCVFTLEQGYVSGKRLYISYTLTDAATRSEFLERRITGELEWPWQRPGEKWEALRVSVNDQVENEQIHQWFATHDVGTMIRYHAGVGDGVRLLDAEGTVPSIVERRETTDENGTVHGYQVMELPQGTPAKIDCTITILYSAMVDMQDEDGAYRAVIVPEYNRQYVTLHIASGKAEADEASELLTTMTRNVQAKDYTATARLEISETEITGRAQLDCPASWTQGWGDALGDGNAKTSDADPVVDYILQAGSERLENMDGGLIVNGDGNMVLTLAYAHPAASKPWRLIPVTLAGVERPEEAMVFE